MCEEVGQSEAREAFVTIQTETFRRVYPVSHLVLATAASNRVAGQIFTWKLWIIIMRRIVVGHLTSSGQGWPSHVCLAIIADIPTALNNTLESCSLSARSDLDSESCLTLA